MLLVELRREPNDASVSKVRAIVPRARASDTLVYRLLNERLRRTPSQHGEARMHARGGGSVGLRPLRAARPLLVDYCATSMSIDRSSSAATKSSDVRRMPCGLGTSRAPEVGGCRCHFRQSAGSPPAKSPTSTNRSSKAMENGKLAGGRIRITRTARGRCTMPHGRCRAPRQ